MRGAVENESEQLAFPPAAIEAVDEFIEVPLEVSLPCRRLLAVAFGYAGGPNTVMAPDRGGGSLGTGPRAARKLFLRGKG